MINEQTIKDLKLKIDKNIKYENVKKISPLMKLVNQMEIGDSILTNFTTMNTIRKYLNNLGYSTQSAEENGQYRIWKRKSK
tara:strand:- start:41 stop:283 length:243 start_codon:yes stop_codon:yes gene_type:complete